jgi:hypothetical protein
MLPAVKGNKKENALQLGISKPGLTNLQKSSLS